jgi:hypothetical protein
MLVRHAQRVPDLVKSGVPPVRRGQVPAEVHRPPRRADREDVPAEVRPRPVALVEADADLRLVAIGDLHELEPDPELLPDPERVADRVALVIRAFEEVVVEDGAVHPLRRALDYRAEASRVQAGVERGRGLQRHRAVLRRLFGVGLRVVISAGRGGGAFHRWDSRRRAIGQRHPTG